MLLISFSRWSIVRRIHHSYREANKCAYMLVNIGYGLSGPLILYESCRTLVSLLFVADIAGVAAPVNLLVVSFLGFFLALFIKKRKGYLIMLSLKF